MAEKSSVFKGALSSDDVAWGLESADNAIVAATVGGAVAAGVATKVMPKGMKRRLRRKKSWVKRKTKRCKERYPRAGEGGVAGKQRAELGAVLFGRVHGRAALHRVLLEQPYGVVQLDGGVHRAAVRGRHVRDCVLLVQRE